MESEVTSARRSGILPHEVVALLYVLCGIVLLERLPVTYPRSALFLSFASPVLLIGSLSLIVLLFLRRTWPFRSGVYTLLRSLLPILFVFPVSFLLKSFIFLINGRNYDVHLSAADVALFFGHSPTIFFTTLFSRPSVLHAIDYFYTGLYYLIFIGYTAFFLGGGSPDRRRRFTASFVYLWMTGTALYLLLPSWGPAFTVTDTLEPTLRHMPHTVSVQRVLFEELSSLVRNPLGRRVVQFGSVAAFPSLHVGAMVLFTLASRAFSARWFRLNLLFCVLMLIGSVVTGYHYLIDGIGGAAIAAVAWWLGRYSAGEYHSPAV